MPPSADATPDRPRKTRKSSLTSPPAKVRKQKKQQAATDDPIVLRRSTRQRQPLRLLSPEDDEDHVEQAVTAIADVDFKDDTAIRHHQQRLRSMTDVNGDGSRLVCGYRVVRFVNCTTRSAEVRIQSRDDSKLEHVYCIKHSHRDTTAKFYCKNCPKTAEDKAFITLKVVDDEANDEPTGVYEVHESGNHSTECAQPIKPHLNCDTIRIYQNRLFVKFRDTVHRADKSLSIQHFGSTFDYKEKHISIFSERYRSTCECRTLVVITESSVWINYGHAKLCRMRNLMRNVADEPVPDDESDKPPFKLFKPYEYGSEVSPEMHAKAVNAVFQVAAVAQGEKAVNQPLAAPPRVFTGAAGVARPSDKVKQRPKTAKNVKLQPIPANRTVPAATREPQFTPSPTPSAQDSGVSTAASNATLNLFTDDYVAPATKLRTKTAQVIGKPLRQPLVTQRSYEKPESSTQDALLSDRRASEPKLPWARSGGAVPATIKVLRRHVVDRNLPSNNSDVASTVAVHTTSQPSNAESRHLDQISEESQPGPSNPPAMVSTVKIPPVISNNCVDGWKLGKIYPAKPNQSFSNFTFLTFSDNNNKK